MRVFVAFLPQDISHVNRTLFINPVVFKLLVRPASGSKLF